MDRKKKYQIAGVAMAALTAATFAAPSVFAATTSTVQTVADHVAGFHRGPFDETKMLTDQSSILGITIDDLKARLASGKTFTQIIADLGLTQDQIKTKMDALRATHLVDMKTKIQTEVTSGKITQAQADQMIANIGKGPQGEKRGMGMMGEGRGPGFGMGSSTSPFATKMLDDQASVLGISVADLRIKLASGKTFDQIATDLGISADVIKTKMEALRATQLADMKTKIQAEVTSGKLTQAQADQMLERLTSPNKHGFGRGMGLEKEGMGIPGGIGSHQGKPGMGPRGSWDDDSSSTSTSQQ